MHFESLKDSGVVSSPVKASSVDDVEDTVG